MKTPFFPCGNPLNSHIQATGQLVRWLLTTQLPVTRETVNSRKKIPGKYSK